MSNPIRVPLVTTIEPRLAEVDKDALASNVFYDKAQDGSTFAAKRPGLTSYLSGSGQGAGLYGEFAFFLNTRSWNIVYGNGVFVAQDWTITADWLRTRLCVSSDGINWTSSILVDSNTNFNSITFDGTYFIMAGSGPSSGVGYRSLDGVTWTTISLPITSPSQFSNVAIISSANGRVFLSNQTTIYYSTNSGTSWTVGTRDASLSPSPIKATAYLSGTYVGADGLCFFYSTNGVNWTRVLDPAVPFGYPATNGSLFVGLNGNGMSYYTSTNGSTWVTGATGRPASVSRGYGPLHYAGGKFIAFTRNIPDFQMMSSSDGTTWTYSQMSDPFPRYSGGRTPGDWAANTSTIALTWISIPSDGTYTYLPTTLETNTINNFNPVASQDFSIVF